MEGKLKADILAVLDEGKDMTIATVRPDGWPQATTVSYASDGLAIYFGCGAGSQKAANLAHEDRVAVTVNLPYRDWSQIRGVTLAGRARRLTDEAALARAGQLFLAKFPEIPQYIAADSEMAMFRIDPVAFSVLNYSKGFGHTDHVEPAELVALPLSP